MQMLYALYVGDVKVAEFGGENTVMLETTRDGQMVPIVGLDVREGNEVLVGTWPNGEEWETVATVYPETAPVAP